VSEIDDKIEELARDKVQYDKEIISDGKERDALHKKLLQLKKKSNLDDAAGIENKIEAIDKDAEEFQKQIHSLRENQHNIIRENDGIQHEINFIDEKINKVVDIEKEYKKKSQELNTKRQQFKKSTLELNKRLDEDSLIASQVSQSRSNLHKLNEEFVSLKARDFGITEKKFGNIAVAKILELKKGGIYGTVAELGNVSSKYALSLEIAAGARIKSIVVDNEKIAAECIKYLKDKKLGTATFLPLTKLQDRESIKGLDKLADSRGSHGIAIDLVTFDPKFKKVFSYVFANTIVVDNIDVALRLGVGNAKFVTLDGDVAERSGVMHGGFRARKKQAMGFKEKELSKDISEIESKISKLKNTIDVLEKRRVENEETITTLREKKASIEGDIIKEEKSLELETSDTEVLKLKKKELKKSEKSLEVLINSIKSFYKKLFFPPFNFLHHSNDIVLFVP